MYAICSPFSVHSIGNTAAPIDSPMNARLPTASSTSAESAFAWERSTCRNSRIVARMIVLKTEARITLDTHMPSRCVMRCTGAMNVYSIVPSQRSQAMTSVTFSKTIPRKRQAMLPTSRYSTNRSSVASSITCPLITLRPAADLPIVPVYTNIFAPPMPQPKRFVELGKTIRRLVESWPGDGSQE